MVLHPNKDKPMSSENKLDHNFIIRSTRLSVNLVYSNPKGVEHQRHNALFIFIIISSYKHSLTIQLLFYVYPINVYRDS